jgi:hypothetical protein
MSIGRETPVRHLPSDAVSVGERYRRDLSYRHNERWNVRGDEAPDCYDAADDIANSVAEGFASIRERVASAGGWDRQKQNGFPDLPDFLRRTPVTDGGGS